MDDPYGWDQFDDDDDFDYEAHGFDCDCGECELQRAMDNCGELPEHLGGGCQSAGSEYCDFECPFRNRVLFGDDVEEQEGDEQ